MKGFVLRALATLLIAGVAGILLAVIPSAPNSDKEYEITDAEVTIELQRDGSLLVHERLPFDFTGSFTGAYRDIPVNGPAEIKNISVFSGGRRYQPGANTELGSFDRPGSFGVEEFRGTADFADAASVEDAEHFYRVVWHYNAADEVRDFDLNYRVENAVDVRDDVVDVTWVVWGDQWDFWLDHLDAQISAASGAEPIDAWVRPRSLGTDPNLGATADASIDRLSEGEAVGFRAVFPRKAISSTAGTVATPGDGLAEIQQQEAQLDDDLGFFDKLKNSVNDNLVAICVALAAIGLFGVALLCLLARESPTDSPKYVSEPPEDIPPALAYALANEGGYDDRVVLATLLDLVDRGYYESRPSEGKDLDLELEVATDRPTSEELEPYEVSTLDFFDRLLGTKWVAIGKMKDEVPKHSTAWHGRWSSLNSSLDAAEKNKLVWDRDLRPWRYWLAFAVGTLFVAVLVLAWLRTHRIAIPATALIATIGLMYAPPGSWLRRLALPSRQRSAHWRAFERWTHDFPSLDDDPPATLKLWRRILVYAVAFGTAERVAKSGRIPAPVTEEAAGGSGLWTAYAFTSPGFGTGFNSFGSDFSSQVAPQSSSSG
nr:DUF2207 domain-containing protein [Solirubrobacterales bacterium]